MKVKEASAPMCCVWHLFSDPAMDFGEPKSDVANTTEDICHR